MTSRLLMMALRFLVMTVRLPIGEAIFAELNSTIRLVRGENNDYRLAIRRSFQVDGRLVSTF